MNIYLVLAHPNKGSFNHAIAETAAATVKHLGHNLWYHDLYDENFDPIFTASEIASEISLNPDIDAHCKKLCEADGIIIIHPNWWSQAPAILKGWVDRVFRAGRAYKFVEDGKGGGYPIGLLKAKSALVINTANTPQEIEVSAYGDPLQIFWQKVVFGLCGVKDFHRLIFSPVITSSTEKRKAWLKEVKQKVIDLYH